MPSHTENASASYGESLRSQLAERLESEGADDLAEKLHNCGVPVKLCCSGCLATSWGQTRCKRKWCPVCARMVAARNAARYRGLVGEMQWPLFSTFTVTNYPDLSADFVREMRRAFSKLRRCKWFQASVAGGIAALEVTNTGAGWHPHVHAVMDARWLAVNEPEPKKHVKRAIKVKAYARAAKEVSIEWSRKMERRGSVSSHRVSRSENESAADIATEVLKYSVKGSDLVDALEDVAPLIRMLDMCRLLTSWGSCYGRLREFDHQKVPCACAECGAIGAIVPAEVMEATIRGGICVG